MWLKGDWHMHCRHSTDSTNNPQSRIIAFAERLGFDYLAITDHDVHVQGAVAHKEELEQTLTGSLAQDWSWERVDRLVRAILLAGAYELIHRKDVPSKVAISEYVEIAHAFYDQGEQNFVNSVLDRIARQSRSAEFAR